MTRGLAKVSPRPHAEKQVSLPGAAHTKTGRLGILLSQPTLCGVGQVTMYMPDADPKAVSSRVLEMGDAKICSVMTSHAVGTGLGQFGGCTV